MSTGSTILDLLAFVLGSGGVIAVLLQRIPGWDGLPANVKKLIVSVIGVVSPVVLIILKVYIPPDILNGTLAQLVTGVAVAAASFVLHLVDKFLAGLTTECEK